MSDIFSSKKRSEIMRSIRSKNTKPELIIRSLVHRMGYRFKLHDKSLPGSPDLSLPKHRKVIFVHGCFWHSHKGCTRAALPVTNKAFWKRKIESNIRRDRQSLVELRRLGWRHLVIWQCQIKQNKFSRLYGRIAAFLDS